MSQPGDGRIPRHPLSQLEAQKLSYFLQLAGEPLQLDFEKHHYGPYADGLYHLLLRLEGHHLHGLVDHSPGAAIELESDSVREASDYLDSLAETRHHLERVTHLIDGFETPYGLELLATVHWVAMERAAGDTPIEDVVAAVHKWSSRKRRLMRPPHVRVAFERLRDRGWLSPWASA